MISLDQVTCRRGGRAVVREATTLFARSEVTAVLGANGAGKSSLLRLASGEWTPHTGHVRWDVTPLARLERSELARRRAVVSQVLPAAFPCRVLDLVLLGRLPHRTTSRRTDTETSLRALDEVGLAGLAARSVETLSGGEHARVHLARALAQLSEARTAGDGALLLDEPTASLYPAPQHRILELARAIAGDGLAVIVVLHDVNLAAAYADRVILMREGGIAAVGTVRDALTPAALREVYSLDFTPVPTPSGTLFFVPTGHCHEPMIQQGGTP